MRRDRRQSRTGSARTIRALVRADIRPGDHQEEDPGSLELSATEWPIDQLAARGGPGGVHLPREPAVVHAWHGWSSLIGGIASGNRP